MRIISRGRLHQFGEQFPDAADSLQKWYSLFREAEWQSLQEVRGVYPHADMVAVGSGSIVTVFNICGNKYRLIVAIHYNTQRVYILEFLRHSDYSKEFWKERL